MPEIEGMEDHSEEGLARVLKSALETHAVSEDEWDVSEVGIGPNIYDRNVPRPTRAWFAAEDGTSVYEVRVTKVADIEPQNPDAMVVTRAQEWPWPPEDSEAWQKLKDVPGVVDGE